MSTEMVFNISIILFLISIIGLFISSDTISAFIFRQIIIIAAIINFLNFSLHIAPLEHNTRILLILGLMTFYLLEFAITYYIYSNTGSTGRDDMFGGYRLLSTEKSDWWGEDKA